MKHLTPYRLFESNKKIYYHGRDSERRPYSGNYIYLTDNMGFGISFSDHKELWAFTLNFPETEIFTISNPAHRNLLRNNLTKESFESVIRNSEDELDWSSLGNMDCPEYEDIEDLFIALGFKALKLRERPSIYSLYVFNQNDVTLVNKIDLTTPEMIKFASDWYLNPGFNII